MKLKKLISPLILNTLNEEQTSNLILYHGSDSLKKYDRFLDNQFYSVNDYIASNYAENNGGLVYKVKVNKLKPFKLVGNYAMSGGRGMKTEEPEQYKLEYNLISKLYGEQSLDLWLKRGFNPSPAYVFGGDWTPIIKWARTNGYDSLQFIDESFDTFVRDVTYLIFKGSKVKILDVFPPDSSE